MKEAAAFTYDTITVSNESTVIAESPAYYSTGADYQSEADLEREFIAALLQQAYEYTPIISEVQLIDNLRIQLEKLNQITFSDKEWKQFFDGCIAGANDGIVDKTKRIQEDHVQVLRRDDSTSKNITLLDKHNIHNNTLQVINQYEAPKEGGARYNNRYDVTILVNGLPLVHVELKRRGVDIREAFNQINRYQRDSFWSGNGLFDYIQIFVISNGTHTKYYSNTTRQNHVEEQGERKPTKKNSNSFEFTSWWADAKNKQILDLPRFTQTFFAKHTLLNILTRYCVFTVDKSLLVMRPYQIVATERILQKITVSTNHKQLGTPAAGGYVWHTTGSGKTLTSFKTARIASQMAGVDKVLFVVDRKDLDYQTMLEYDKFEKGAANSNTSTNVLRQQLENPEARIIITTIQKLSWFIKANSGHTIYQGHIVIIFDECHRSQFGDMHTSITRAFKRYHLFGFTGTPIFEENAGSAGRPNLRTTDQAFGDRLHTYTVVNAIADKNVLPFRVDYINTIKMPDGVTDKKVSGIDTETALLDPERIRQVVAYTLEHFNQKTKRESLYEHRVVENVNEVVHDRGRVDERRVVRRVRGFNSIFATASIDAAQLYYLEFKRQQAELPPDRRLRIGIIYSYAANPDEEGPETSDMSANDRSFLEAAIQDYNRMFGTNYDTSADRFENYYKALSRRLKNQEIDMVIVVNMFLTGFDATTMNTLWVDKNLRMHGLVQAYSRTNRILNSVKAYGNIVTFRNLSEETDAAMTTFGDPEERSVAIVPPYSHFADDYAGAVAELVAKFPIGEPILGESNKKDFVMLWGRIMKLHNVLTSFDEFMGNDTLSERQHQDYTSVYINFYHEFRKEQDGEKEAINDDLVFEIELVKQVEVNVDYILILVEQYRKKRGDQEGDSIRDAIFRSIDASPSLRNKRDLIEAFVDDVSLDGEIDQEWKHYINGRRNAELEQIIAEENLRPDPARAFIDSAFRDGGIQTTGTAIIGVLPPTSRFGTSEGVNLQEKKRRVLEKLGAYFERFQGLISV